MVPRKASKTATPARDTTVKRRSGKKSAPDASAKTQAQESRSLQITAEERYKMIAHIAYLRAEKRGFIPGHEVDDWLQAESEVDQMLRGG